jgi:SWI/SNF-related matrix-associated actin-dependent regulator of chromatin subfamily A containing DEAD/H box 1
MLNLSCKVERNLPGKTERIEWCELTDQQKAVYDIMRQQSLGEEDANTLQSNSPVNYVDQICFRHGSNRLMNLRKASLHPMLFRVHFTDDILATASELLSTNAKFISKKISSRSLEDELRKMTDAELQIFFKQYKVCPSALFLRTLRIF